MENFKEIAEKCLIGELSGRFVCRDGLQISSFTLSRTDNPWYPYKLYRTGVLNKKGCTPNIHSHNDIIQFIPYQDMKKEQITISIPEGMEAVQEIVDEEIRIKFINKKLTLADIPDSISNFCNAWYYQHNEDTAKFYKKVEVLRKLTNIRNYFGKPNGETAWFITRNIENKYICCQCVIQYSPNCNILFAKKEHAQAAIDMLGDELKYSFEPW